MMILFLGNMVVEPCRFPIAGLESILTPVAVPLSRFLLFFGAFAKVMPDALFLDIISRQIVIFPYLTARAFFDVAVR